MSQIVKLVTFLLLLHTSLSTHQVFNMSTKWDTDEVVQRFRDYLRIASVHPDVDYSECVSFLQKQAKLINLPIVVHELVPKKPVVVITWKGQQPELPSILLSSHMDVVPVYEEHWKYPPFEAVISENGFIYARGTQDMKSVGMFHLEAVRRLKDTGVRLKRTVHISFTPDEEIGSSDGMKTFAGSDEFQKLNVGFGLDEGRVNLSPDTIQVFYGERISIQFKITSKGEPGHGALLQRGTAGEKIYYVINKLMTLRDEELKKMEAVNGWFGDFTNVNLMILEGGIHLNVLPKSLSATFDTRIPPNVIKEEFVHMLEEWCAEAGDDVILEHLVNNPQVQSTQIDGSVPFWTALKEAVEKKGLNINASICPGATDARFLRAQGIPAINFTPILNTPTLAHMHNEKIHVDEYKKGIDIMTQVVAAVANV